MFVSKHVIFLEREFLLRDSESKVELKEVQSAQIDANLVLELEAVIHRDEVAIDPSKAQALRRSSRIHIVPERYGFLKSE